MQDSTASDPVLHFFGEIMESAGDQAALKRLRRRIRASPHLSQTERTELLEQAQFEPGCIPALMTLADDGTLRPMTDDEIEAERLAEVGVFYPRV